MNIIIRKVIGHEFGVSNSWLATPYTHAKLECGHVASVCVGKHDLTEIKTEYPCEICGDVEAKRKELLEVKATKRVTHTRARQFCGQWYITVYGRDETSPSGVIAVASYPDIPELNDIFSGSLSPLSPTEGL